MKRNREVFNTEPSPSSPKYDQRVLVVLLGHWRVSYCPISPMYHIYRRIP